MPAMRARCARNPRLRKVPGGLAPHPAPRWSPSPWRYNTSTMFCLGSSTLVLGTNAPAKIAGAHFLGAQGSNQFSMGLCLRCPFRLSQLVDQVNSSSCARLLCRALSNLNQNTSCHRGPACIFFSIFSNLRLGKVREVLQAKACDALLIIAGTSIDASPHACSIALYLMHVCMLNPNFKMIASLASPPAIDLNMFPPFFKGGGGGVLQSFCL